MSAGPHDSETRPGRTSPRARTTREKPGRAAVDVKEASDLSDMASRGLEVRGSLGRRLRGPPPRAAARGCGARPCSSQAREGPIPAHRHISQQACGMPAAPHPTPAPRPSKEEGPPAVKLEPTEQEGALGEGAGDTLLCTEVRDDERTPVWCAQPAMGLQQPAAGCPPSPCAARMWGCPHLLCVPLAPAG